MNLMAWPQSLPAMDLSMALPLATLWSGETTGCDAVLSLFKENEFKIGDLGNNSHL